MSRNGWTRGAAALAVGAALLVGIGLPGPADDARDRTDLPTLTTPEGPYRTVVLSVTGMT